MKLVSHLIFNSKHLKKLISRDFVDGGSCKFDPQSNLPNGNCIFVPSNDNSKVRSSYMSLPFLSNVSFFNSSKGPFINYVTHLGGGVAIVLPNVTEGGGVVDRSVM